MAQMEPRSALWKQTLAPQESDDEFEAAARRRLRDALAQSRERAEVLAAEIARELPDYTVHDVSHLDALWEIADLVAGSTYPLTPIEAFVFGEAALLHDLGMGLAAYPEGIAVLRDSVEWTDSVTVLLRTRLGRPPTPEEIAAPPEDITRIVLAETLRNRHANRAELLGTIAWEDSRTGDDFYLIENADLRYALGSAIGRIGASHHWDVADVGLRLSVERGAPAGLGMPQDWDLDPLKVACLLRAADAAHIDARRAPRFLRTIRRPGVASELHWVFQQNLLQGRFSNEQLVFTTNHGFSIDEAEAWWLCFDTLQMIDGELHAIDQLFIESNRPRFAARSVAGAQVPTRLTRYIPTASWTPVDTEIRVTAVADLVTKLGGSALYGEDPAVPLRELIQNAADAVRARRIAEKRADDWGEISIVAGSDEAGGWIEVSDTGVGMSEQLLTGPLLDFGTSYWGSALMRQELPGLLSQGFVPTGRFGIGFFSVFMLGSRIRVTTRRAQDPTTGTRVLEFGAGLDERPLLRAARADELLVDPGTRVRVWLDAELIGASSGRRHIVIGQSLQNGEDLARVVAWTCPTLDVTVVVGREGEQATPAVRAADWLNLSNHELLHRISLGMEAGKDEQASAERSAVNMREIHSADGTVLGKAAVTVRLEEDLFFYRTDSGAAVASGFRVSDIPHVVGVFESSVSVASRNEASARVDAQILADWASEQAHLAVALETSLDRLGDSAAVIRALGGDPGSLPIAFDRDGFLTRAALSSKIPPDELIIVQDAAVWTARREHRGLNLDAGVIVVAMGRPGLGPLSDVAWQDRSSIDDHPNWEFVRQTLEGVVIEATAAAWGVDLQALLDSSEFSSDETEITRRIGESEDGPVVEDVSTVLHHPSSLHQRTGGGV